MKSSLPYIKQNAEQVLCTVVELFRPIINAYVIYYTVDLAQR